MSIQLTGDCGEIETGFKNILEYDLFPIPESEPIRIAVEKLKDSGTASFEVGTQNGLHIAYREPSHFFRGLSVLLENRDKKDFKHQETALFKGCSAMIDLSRNAVYTVAMMKRLLAYMALIGQNRLYLYMEDTYELPDYPYFGYLRGRYSLAELKQIDDFADSLGIEVIPCIQTLAHLKTTLRWEYAQGLKDTDDILLVGDESVYRFIESMLVTLKNTFRTRKIHIGMDEAMNLGTGNYMKKHGPCNQFELMVEHLNRVNGIAEKLGLHPMMWDDMFYRSHDVNHDYYNLNIKLSEQDKQKVPKNIGLAYWDYYHNTEADYDQLFAMRDSFVNEICFAGGIWRWMGYVPMYSKTFTATNAALSMCKKHKVSEIMATAWGDDGAETPIQTILPGLILYGEHCFGQPTDNVSISRRCKFLTGLSLEDFQTIEQLDLLPGCENPNLKTRNPSKHILYQDLLLGAFDPYFTQDSIPAHYRRCEAELNGIAQRAGTFKNLFVMYAELAGILSVKAQLGTRLRTAYQAGEKEKLEQTAKSDLPQLRERIVHFKKAFSKVWFSESKGQGFEVIDIRMGGLMSRIDTSAERILSYVNGEIEHIEELEEKLLPYTQGAYSDEAYVCFNLYSTIVTQNILGW